MTTQPGAPTEPSRQAFMQQLVSLTGLSHDYLADMMDAVARGETRREYFGFSDEVLRSMEDIALGYYRGQRYTEAEQVFRLVLILSEDQYGPAWRGLGACAQVQERFGEARQAFERALACDAKDSHSAVYLGECLCLLGERDEGLRVLRALLADVPPRTIAQTKHLKRAQGIVQAGGPAATPKPRVAAQPAAAASAEAPAPQDAHEAVAHEVVRLLNGQQPVEDPTIQALLDDPDSHAQLETLAQAVRQGGISLRQIADFSQEQMDAGYAVACQLLERGEPLKAVEMAGYMLYLDSRDTRFYRLAGLSMHHLKLWCLADYLYTLVGIYSENKPDAATLVYQGEVKLMIEERAEGVALLKRGITLAGQDPTFADIVRRGQQILTQLEQAQG
jgi:tetratricopeptide (TPR) repeat protein